MIGMLCGMGRTIANGHLKTASGRRQVDERRAVYATHLSPDAGILRHVTGCEGGAGK